MSAFDAPLASLVSAVGAAFGTTVTWTPQVSPNAPFTLSAVIEQGEQVERRDKGMYLALANVKLSDLSPAIAGSTDLSSIQGDQVAIASPAPAWMQGTYRVQLVTDPDPAGTVRVELRRFPQ